MLLPPSLLPSPCRWSICAGESLSHAGFPVTFFSRRYVHSRLRDSLSSYFDIYLIKIERSASFEGETLSGRRVLIHQILISFWYLISTFPSPRGINTLNIYISPLFVDRANFDLNFLLNCLVFKRIFVYLMHFGSIVNFMHYWIYSTYNSFFLSFFLWSLLSCVCLLSCYYRSFYTCDIKYNII